MSVVEGGSSDGWEGTSRRETGVSTDAGEEVAVLRMRTTITGTHTISKRRARPYTAYEVETIVGDRRFVVLRRYKEFLALHERLQMLVEQGKLPSYAVPTLPPKSNASYVLKSNLEENFVKMRAQRLQHYLWHAMGIRLPATDTPKKGSDGDGVEIFDDEEKEETEFHVDSEGGVSMEASSTTCIQTLVFCSFIGIDTEMGEAFEGIKDSADLNFDNLVSRSLQTPRKSASVGDLESVDTERPEDKSFTSPSFVGMVSQEETPSNSTRLIGAGLSVRRKRATFIESVGRVDKEGKLYIKGTFSWNTRYAILTGRELHLLKNKQDFTPVTKINLVGFEAHSPDPFTSGSSATQFFLTSASQKASYEMKTDSLYETNQWVASIKLAAGRPESLTQTAIVSYSDIKMEKLLGSGTSAEVYKGRWNGTVVAVKKLSVERVEMFCGGDAIKQFLAEVTLMSHIRHPNVLLFLGAVAEPPNYCLISEYCERGSADAVLKKIQRMKQWPRAPLLLQMLMDTARGLAYLHSLRPPIIHRDLKSMNLMVDETYHVRVADFGFSKFKEDNKMMSFVCTASWAAPEVLRQQDYSEKADVYAFGIVLWEFLTGASPYEELSNAQVILGVTTKGVRPPVPPSTPDKYRALMEACWNPYPSRRPSFNDILAELNYSEAEVSELDKSLRKIWIGADHDFQKDSGIAGGMDFSGIGVKTDADYGMGMSMGGSSFERTRSRSEERKDKFDNYVKKVVVEASTVHIQRRIRRWLLRRRRDKAALAIQLWWKRLRAMSTLQEDVPTPLPATAQRKPPRRRHTRYGSWYRHLSTYLDKGAADFEVFILLMEMEEEDGTLLYRFYPNKKRKFVLRDSTFTLMNGNKTVFATDWSDDITCKADSENKSAFDLNVGVRAKFSFEAQHPAMRELIVHTVLAFKARASDGDD
mmetsp:Transcript_44487/g.115675  ORF Transcript_44487/g.115675 Transcript_44487/m.115675 type:complete len:927 (-) Transcript_44487:742-3522(-)